MPEDGSSSSPLAGPQPGESPKERVDRELIELLNGLRVILPGVQVLLAFLLTVPFSSGFDKISSTIEIVYFVTVLITAGAIAFLAAPAAYHRLRFREGDKERMLFTSNVYAIVGLGLLALAMTGVVFLITSVLFGNGSAVIVAVLVLTVFVTLWFGIPLWRKVDESR
ncbi:MAG: DUF6328 family protein [Gemmatimonadota bacterium]